MALAEEDIDYIKHTLATGWRNKAWASLLRCTSWNCANV